MRTICSLLPSGVPSGASCRSGGTCSWTTSLQWLQTPQTYRRIPCLNSRTTSLGISPPPSSSSSSPVCATSGKCVTGEKYAIILRKCVFPVEASSAQRVGGRNYSKRRDSRNDEPPRRVQGRRGILRVVSRSNVRLPNDTKRRQRRSATTPSHQHTKNEE